MKLAKIFVFAYDETGRLISAGNPEGALREWKYNEDDTLQISIDENGAETVYSYNEKKLAETVTNAIGDVITLAYIYIPQQRRRRKPI